MFIDQYICNTKNLYFADTMSFSEIYLIEFKPRDYQFTLDWWYISIRLPPTKPPLFPRFTVSTPEHKVSQVPFQERLQTLDVLL
jgi:hypothetical protein